MDQILCSICKKGRANRLFTYLNADFSQLNYNEGSFETIWNNIHNKENADKELNKVFDDTFKKIERYSISLCEACFKKYARQA